MFEEATRLKLRFPYKGPCTVEDLWDLNLTSLDGVYKALRKEQKADEGDSLLATPEEDKTKLGLRIDIVKHVVGIKLAEQEARKMAKEKREQKQRIMEIIAQKQDEALAGKSIDELTKLLDNL